MSGSSLGIILIVLVVLLGIGGAVLYFLFRGNKTNTAQNIQGLMSSAARNTRSERTHDDTEDTIEKIKRQTGSAKAGKQEDNQQAKLFRAGFYTSADKKRFKIFQVTSMIIAPIVCTAFLYGMTKNPTMLFVGLGFGLGIGAILPGAWLDRQIARRQEEVMYFLPLVIEQVSIGVSSALDVGPCIAQIVSMADERDSHNPITEMFIHVEKLIRSGLNLEDALVEVGDITGLPDVKHGFMFLAQCAKHGGEVSRQLQELADAVMVQRQVQVEAKIASLPVKATGPLTTVFAGFFGLLFAGLAVKMMSAFGG